jgi:hypothetical protein
VGWGRTLARKLGVELGWDDNRLRERRACLEELASDKLRTHSRKHFLVKCERAIFDRLNVVMFWVVIRSFEDALVQTSIINGCVGTTRLAYKCGCSVFGLAGFAEELTDIPDIAFVLEASTIEVEPQLAAVAANPLVQLTMVRFPSLSAASAYSLLNIF